MAYLRKIIDAPPRRVQPLLLEDRSDIGRFTGNDYRQIKEHWHDTVKIRKLTKAADKNEEYKAINQLRIGRFLSTGQFRLPGTDRSIRICPEDIIFNERTLPEYRGVLILLPHSDDICWSGQFIGTYAERNPQQDIYSTLFSADKFGITSEIGTAICRELLEYMGHGYHELTSGHMQAILRNYRDLERISAETFLGITGFGPKDNNSSSLELSELVMDDQDKVYPYLSARIRQDKLMEQQIKEMFYILEPYPQGKVLVLMPFILDNHPVHRRLAKVILQQFSQIDCSEKFDIWMYGSSDVLIGHKTNTYFTFSDYQAKLDLWRKFKTQVTRFPEYPYFNAALDRHNAALAGLDAPYAEKFIRIKLVEK